MVTVPQLHLITPPIMDAATLVAVKAAVAAPRALPMAVQIRIKTGTDRERLQAAAALADVARDGGAMVLVDDRVDIALAIEADGVHVGDDDLPVAVARRVLGPDAVIGATCRTPEAAVRAAADGATYLGVGPAYATTTKIGLPDPIGPAGISAVVAAVDLPVIAIAGVTPDRVVELLAAGAHGVAVVGAVFAADDPARATGRFFAALEDTP